jgi:putative ABC transport system substrate-binding protein
MRRREFITLLGGAAAWPVAARAQLVAMPVIGYLDAMAPDTASTDRLHAFRQGLKDAGYVEGDNIAFEYRSAHGRFDRLSAMAAELVRRDVDVMVAIGGVTPALAAKAVTSKIPIVFTAAQDPVKVGLVDNIAKPGGNVTGILLPAESTVRRLDLLRELVPRAARIAVLLDPVNSTDVASISREVEAAAVRIHGLQIKVYNASTGHEVDTAFASFGRQPPDALVVGPFSTDRSAQLARLTQSHRMPAAYPGRDFVAAGGLMSYGTNLRDAYRQAGVHVGRILKGANPADLPVVQSSKYELVINTVAARHLGLTVPPTLLARADEVIE